MRKLAVLVIPLLLAACGGPSDSTPTPAPDTPANFAGEWEVRTSNVDTDTSRLWLALTQTGSTIGGKAYTGYRNADGTKWVEPYGLTVTGSVEGNKVTFNVPWSAYGMDDSYTFTGAKTSAGFSGTWITKLKRGGNFTAVPWK